MLGALRHRGLVLALAGCLLVFAAVLASRLGTEFIPRLSEHALVIATQRLADVSLDESNRYGTQIEKLLLASFPDEIDHIWTRTGRAEIATDPMGINLSDTYVLLKPREEWTSAASREELVEEMEAKLKELPTMAYTFSQPIEFRMMELIEGVGSRSDVVIKIFGEDLDELREQAGRVAKVMAGVRGVADLKVQQLSGQPVLSIKANREAIARHGAARVGVFIGTSTSGVLQTELAYRERDPVTGALPAWFRYEHTHNIHSVSAFVREAFGIEE